LISDDSGYLTVPDRPGWGIGFDPEAARKHPITNTAGMINVFTPGWERRSFK
jgi:hypothetical protein